MFSLASDEIKKIEEELKRFDEKAIIQKSNVADLSSVMAFRIARERKCSPQEIAEEIAGKIRTPKIIKCVKADRGYLNFFFDYAEFGKLVIGRIVEEGWERREKKVRIILEHTSVNPSGPIHVGRLRNSLIGDSLARILSFDGYEVETRFYVNDIGKQVAVIAAGIKSGLKPRKDLIDKYEKYRNKDDFGIFFIYVDAVNKFEESEDFRSKVQELLHRVESGDKEAAEALRGIAKRGIDGQRQTLERMDIKFDRFDYESDLMEEAHLILSSLKKKGNEYIKEVDSCIGLDLSEFGISRESGATILSRSDGTSVYLLRDIAYHLRKVKECDVIINVLGEDHKLEFAELKTILQQFFGVKTPIESVHFSFVNFAGEKLSTRKGVTLPVDELIDTSIEKAREEIKKRGVGGIDAAEMIGIGAVKYHILKTTPDKQITFKWEDALSFDGDAAPYIQYAHARCAGILEKSSAEEISIERIDYSDMSEPEKKLLLKMAEFADTVERASNDRKPNFVAEYLYELSCAFSKFYKECPVIGSSPGVKERRLALVKGTKKILHKGLDLLGIGAPDKM